MKKTISLLFVMLFLFSYGVTSSTAEVPQKVPLIFTSTDPNPGPFVDIPYTGIRIGEYYWTNTNLNHNIPARQVFWYDQKFFYWTYGTCFLGMEVGEPITQRTLDRYMPCHLMDPSVYQLNNINDFKKYYGSYYNFREIEYMGGSNGYGEYRAGYGVMREGTDQKVMPWRVPSQADFAQLFAMSHRGGDNINIHDVSINLGTRIGENPLAQHLQSNGQAVGWFDRNTNKYGFNMMPGGGRVPVEGDTWKNDLNPPGGWIAKRGDLYHLFQAEYFHTMEDDGSIMSIGLHDRITFYKSHSEKWINTRYCRRLTPEELGYELYVPSSLIFRKGIITSIDIKKLPFNQTPPSGYVRLPNGYLRGLYVLHILDNPNPTLTLGDLVNIVLKTIDVNVSDEGPGDPAGDILAGRKYVPAILKPFDPPLVNGGDFELKEGASEIIKDELSISRVNIYSERDGALVYSGQYSSMLSISSLRLGVNYYCTVHYLDVNGVIIRKERLFIR